MKIAVIPDIHGRDFWKKIIEKEKDSDLFIFLGDYWDSFDIPFDKQRENFLEILALRKRNKNVILLVGNHDYFPYHLPQTSGYQIKYALEIKHIMQSNKKYFKMCFIKGKYMFTHAGVSSKFLNRIGWNNEPIASFLNKKFKEDPYIFRFWDGYDSEYGDDPEQSCIWIRPSSLISNQEDILYNQIVGHTNMGGIVTVNNNWFVDNQHDYITIENNEVLTHKTE